jgi:hypothetical protein
MELGMDDLTRSALAGKPPVAPVAPVAAGFRHALLRQSSMAVCSDTCRELGIWDNCSDYLESETRRYNTQRRETNAGVFFLNTGRWGELDGFWGSDAGWFFFYRGDRA